MRRAGFCLFAIICFLAGGCSGFQVDGKIYSPPVTVLPSGEFKLVADKEACAGGVKVAYTPDIYATYLATDPTTYEKYFVAVPYRFVVCKDSDVLEVDKQIQKYFSDYRILGRKAGYKKGEVIILSFAICRKDVKIECPGGSVHKCLRVWDFRQQLEGIDPSKFGDLGSF